MKSEKVPAGGAFKKKVWSHYRLHRRDMPWRADHSPYFVIVSEIMLQQTQVARVVRKFQSFVKRFPDWKALAAASTKEVLQEWSGLGYNRRALALKKIAEKVTNDTDKEFAFLDLSVSRAFKASNGKPRGMSVGEVPSLSRHFHQLKWAQKEKTTPTPFSRLKIVQEMHFSLLSLPGIGPNTAGSILAFAFNIPIPFIETNIRSVFIHHFFARSKSKIPDKKLLPLIEAALDQKKPREWYYALMDYGSYLKTTSPNPSRKSAHHVKQSAFKGSNREQRSNLLKLIMREPRSLDSIQRTFKKSGHAPEKIEKNIKDLIREGFITEMGGTYAMAL